MNGKALIIVDVQNDFCPGGALPVSGGNEIIPTINELIRRFKGAGYPIFATQDWHPVNHCSFIKYGGTWQPHCVQNSRGADFHPDLEVDNRIITIKKGTSLDKDAYSGFDGTELHQELLKREVSDIYICGLATDYCVKATVLDGLKHGFTTFVIADAIRGVEVHPEDSQKALEEMRNNGAILITSCQL